MKNKIRFLAMMLIGVLLSVNQVWGTTYTKATSLQTGDKIVLVCEAKSMELTGISTTSTKYGIGTSYTTSVAGTYVLDVVAGSETNSFSFKRGDNYLRWNSGNSLDAVATSVAKNSSWIVTFDTDGNATIKNANDATRVIWWNVNSPRFACYTGKSDGNDYKYVQIYKQESSCTEPTTPLSITASPASIALNKTSTITANGGNGGTISYEVSPTTGSVSAGIFSATATGTYTITATQAVNAGKCAQEAQCTVTVTNITYTDYLTECGPTMYDVKFYTDNGSTQYGTTQSVEESHSPVAPANPTPASGYEFAGWSLTWEGPVVTVTDQVITAPTNFYAKWEMKKPTQITLTSSNGFDLIVGDVTTISVSAWEPADLLDDQKGITYSFKDDMSGKANINATTGEVTTIGVCANCTIVGTSTADSNIKGEYVIHINAPNYFANNKTIFIMGGSYGNAWADNACVKAWYSNNGGGGAAPTPTWIYDNTYKIFALVMPEIGDYNQIQLQRFPENCTGNMWNVNGTVYKSGQGDKNVIISNSSGNDVVDWHSDILHIYLRGTLGTTWNENLGELTDQGAGIFQYTYTNYESDGIEPEFKWADSFGGWQSGDNVKVTGMVNGSTYNLIATLDVTQNGGAFTVSKELVACKVHFDMQGHGSEIASLTGVTPNSKIEEPTTPTEENYRFDGWYKEAGCTNAWNFTTDEVQETMTLYAKWTRVYTYTFSGEDISGCTSGEAGAGEVVNLCADPVITGKNFTGWTVSGGVVVSGSANNYYFTMPSNNVTITAGLSWKTTAITLDKNNSASGNADGSATATYGTGLSTYVAATRAETSTYKYELTGYYTQKTSGGEKVIDEEGNLVAGTTYTDGSGNWIGEDPTLTLYARWDNYCQVTWVNNGGTVATTYIKQNETVGDENMQADLASSVACSSKYNNFVGWYTEASGTETSPAAAAPATKVTASTVVDKKTTYYAVWADGAGGGSWSKVTALSQLSNDDEVFYANEVNNLPDQGVTGHNNNKDATISSNEADWTAFTVTFVDDNAFFKLNNTTGYVSLSDGAFKLLETTDCKFFINDDGFPVYTNAGSTDIALAYRFETTPYYRGYKVSTIKSNSYTPVYLWKRESGATGYISSCCSSDVNIAITSEPASPLALGLDGHATSTVSFAKTATNNIWMYQPTISPSGATFSGWSGTYKTADYSLTFDATAAGTYTISEEALDKTLTCSKVFNAEIVVEANPIIAASTDALTVNGQCGLNGSASNFTIDTRYLSSTTVTVTASTSSTTGGAYKVSKDNSTFSNSVTFEGGTADKVSQTIYVRYEGVADEAGTIAGNIAISGGGATAQNVALSGECSCGTYVTLTATGAEATNILAPNGQWTRAMKAIHIKGGYLTNEAANVNIKLTSSNSKFKFTTGTSEGTADWASGSVTTATYDQDIYIVYTPDAYNATESATITAQVVTYGGTTPHGDAAVITVNGRSLPETFVLALNTGSQWVAVPADMIPPYGGSQGECSTGVGTHDPYPITVDNNANPTVASEVPARAIYKGASRNTPTTQPWTVQFESNSQAGYMLWGSQNATTIANQAMTTSENIKWNMFTNDLVTFQMKLKDDLNSGKLGYNGTSGQNNIGQYSNTASAYKYDFRILPITGDPCYYYVNPVMTVENYTATTTTISIPYDGTTNYMYSIDNKANWTAITGTIDCKKLLFNFANSTFKGKDIWMKADAVVCQGDATSETAMHIPNPSISVNSSVEFDATQNVAFNGEIDITLTDIWVGAGGGVNVATATTAGITAVYNSTTGKIDVSMAGKAPGDYEASLTISSVGATSKTVNVTIHVLSLATQTISCDAISNGVLCGLTTSTGFVLDGAFYKNGTILSQMSDFNSSNRDVIDVASGESVGGMNAALSNGVVTLTMPAGTISEMVAGHVYRVTWENAGHDLTNSAGVEYANCHLDFVYSENCDAPTVMIPCVTGPNSAVINWAGDCDVATSTVSVYTKEQQQLYSSSLKSSGGITWNIWNKYSTPSAYYSKWFYYLKQGSWTAPTSTYGPFINKASTNIYLYTPQIGSGAAMDWGSMDKVDIANIDFTITVDVYCYNNAKSLRCFIVDGEPANTTGTMEDNGKDVYWNGASVTAKSYVSETVSPTSRDETLKSFTVRGLTATSRIAFCVGSYASSAGLYVQKVKIVAAKKGSPTNVNESCASGEKAISGLTANTTYFATVTNNGNTSNEVSFKTYTNGTKSLVFKDELSNPVTTVMVLGGIGQEKTITIEGTKLAGCDIQAEVSAGYGLDDSGLTFNPATGAVGGTVVLTLTDPTVTEGTFTITDGAGTVYTLNLTSSNCPAGINTMATAATGITDHGADANWSTTVTSQAGTLELYKNGIVNRELIENGGFEANTLAGWNDYEVGYGYSCDAYAVSSTNARTGSYCLAVTDDGSAFPGIYSGFSLIYSNALVLEPGTYRFSAWVNVRNETGNDNKDDFRLAFTGGYWNGSSSQPNKAFVWSETTTVQASEGYVQLTADFELSSTIKCHPVIAVKGTTGTFRDFWLDDVTLIRTSAPINDEPHQIYNIADLSVGTQALTDLSGNTSYSYKLINEDGCESNTITFVTTQPGAPVIEAESITLTASQDKTANGVIIVSAIDAYAPITITSCGDSRITLNVSSVSSDGGAVLVTFNPGSTPPGTSGKCTLSLSTMGLDASVQVDVNWTVTAGEDVNTPKVDVTEVWTDQLTIEHNVGLDAVDSVYVQFNREKTEEEIVKNVGDEIFFSKYYEATGDLKLWAIFNPTNDTISLEGMEVWRSKSDGTWNTEQVIDLSDAGWYKRGWISPQEEIIVYTADKVGGCEQRHADMTTWNAGKSTMQPLSFSGDDALLLVRNTSAVSEDNNNILPETSAKDETPISWPDAITARESNWYMLDIIGAHDGLYAPDDSECKTWNWHNSKTGLDESGDAAGWTGYGSDMQGSRDYNGGQGYLLSTNRCLLVRSKEVTSGANALAQNINDMFTLSTEWQGSHVPTSTPGMTEDSVSCVNFTYVGGYNYAGYYNSWTKMEDINMPAEQNPDGSWTVEVDVPAYSCKMFHIEAVKMDTINGVVSPNVVTSTDYKVPIVVAESEATTAELFNFGGDTCKTCDVVIRDEATLSHVTGGKSQFRELIVYPGAKFDNSSKQGFLLDRITVQSKNTEVGYAIINDNGSSIAAGEVRHVKRVDDQHWYSFSLPYDCKISSIQQQNGKSMGEYTEDWVIAYYDGEQRQADRADGHIGESSVYWIDMPSDGVLEANKAYIIGLYTTEWPGQVKNVYFPPYVATGHEAYTESGDDAKTAKIYNWTEGIDNNPARNHGWNFVGSPYISKFNETTDGQGLNNGSLIMKGKMNEAGEITEDLDHVYISVPADADMMTYNQVLASSQKILPFTGYFVQAIDPTSGSDETLTLEYAKGNRTLETPERRATATRQRVLVELNVIAPNGDKDNTGIWVDDRYTVDYEIGRDLMKMYGEAGRPQLYSRAADNLAMAYIALPDEQAEYVPLELYAPKAGAYILKIDENTSMTAGAQSIELLYNDEVVANLFFDAYEIAAAKAGTIRGYAVRIRRIAQVTTSNEQIGGQTVTIITNEGKMSITNLPDGAVVSLYDVLGHRMAMSPSVDGIVNFEAPMTGVYNIVVETAAEHVTIKTVIK